MSLRPAFTFTGWLGSVAAFVIFSLWAGKCEITFYQTNLIIFHYVDRYARVRGHARRLS